MPISAIGNNPSKTMSSRGRVSGFSLIEVLVVLVIVAVTASFMALAIPESRTEQNKFKEQLVSWLSACSVETQLSGAVLGLYFSTGEENDVTVKVYDLQRRLNMWREFHCADAHEFSLALSPSNVELAVYGEVAKIEAFDPAKVEPQLLLLPSGEVTPFALSLFRQIDLRVSSTGFGEILVEPIDE